MPWNNPSNQPTSWAWAIRSSASLGVESSANGRVMRRSSSTSSGARPCSNSRIDRSWISASRRPPGVVERRRPDFFQQLFDHTADPHDLGGLLNVLGGATPPSAVCPVTAIPSGATRSPGPGPRRSLPARTWSCVVLPAHQFLRGDPGLQAGEGSGLDLALPTLRRPRDARLHFRFVFLRRAL